MTIKYKKIREGAKVPFYGSDLAAAADLYACCDDLVIKPGETVIIPTGIALEIPDGYAAFIYARSSLGIKEGLAPANKVGVIDADYRGEIMVGLYNHSNFDRKILHNERIAQMVIAPYIKADFFEVNELSVTNRGDGKFGSTGKK